MITQDLTFSFLSLKFLREGIVEHLCNSIDFVLELFEASMFRLELFLLLQFLRKFVFCSIQLLSNLFVSSGLIINRSATYSSFFRLPVSMLKLYRS